MAGIRCDVQAIEYAALAGRGEIALLERLASPAGPAGYPRLDPARVVPSDSPWLDRGAAAREIARQNPALPAPDPECDYVVTGQQAGLMTGPLYAFLKAATAIAVARDLSARTGRAILPLFWVAGEDHDVLEVNRFTVNGRRFVREYSGEISRGRMPQVADIDLHDAREPLLRFLAAELPATEFTPWILAQVTAADFRSYATAFADLMRGLFARWELRLVDPIGLRPLTAPVLAALVARWPAASAALAEGAARLSAAGLAAPLDELRLFEIADGLRVSAEADGAGLRIGGRALGWEAAAEAIRQAPERFSGGAALRPICQDAALPVAATIGGPSELAYLWQVLPVAECAGVRSSARHPRISATFVGSSIARAVAAARIEARELFKVGDLLQAPEGGERPDPRAAEIESATRDLLARIDALAVAGDPRWLRTSREAIGTAVERITTRLGEERLAEQGRTRERLEKIAAALAPEGKLQERVVNPYQFLNLHGPDFVRETVERLDPWLCAHQLVWIRSGEA